MDVLQLVIQGGAVGLAAYALFVMSKISDDSSKIVGNHISHNTDALSRLTEVLARLDQFLKDKLK